jgi:hypothetical protein
MTPFDVKFPRDTQFTFGSLTFVAWEEGDLKMLPLEAALERLVLAHGPDPYSPANSSTLGGACSELDPYARLFIRTIEIVQGIPVVTSILHPSAGASSSSSSAASLDHDSADDYPEIGGSTYWNCSKEGGLICMVGHLAFPLSLHQRWRRRKLESKTSQQQ